MKTMAEHSTIWIPRSGVAESLGGTYKIGKRVSNGYVCEVYEAEDKSNGERVVIRKLKRRGSGYYGEPGKCFFETFFYFIS